MAPTQRNRGQRSADVSFSPSSALGQLLAHESSHAVAPPSASNRIGARGSRLPGIALHPSSKSVQPAPSDKHPSKRSFALRATNLLAVTSNLGRLADLIQQMRNASSLSQPAGVSCTCYVRVCKGLWTRSAVLRIVLALIQRRGDVAHDTLGLVGSRVCRHKAWVGIASSSSCWIPGTNPYSPLYRLHV